MQGCSYVCKVTMFVSAIVIHKPDDVTICEGEGAVFTCVLDTTDSNLTSDDVQWYSSVLRNRSITEGVDQQGNNNTLNTTLTITNVTKSYTGYYWVGTPYFNVCNVSLTLSM